MNSGEKITFGKRKGIETGASAVPEAQKAAEAGESHKRTPEYLLDLADKYGDNVEFGDTLRTLADVLSRQETGARVPEDSRRIDELLNEANKNLLRLGQKPMRREEFFPNPQ